MNHIQITIKVAEQEKKETLMALLLTNVHLTGIEETKDGLIAYWEEEYFPEEDLMEMAGDNGFTFEQEKLADRNWNEEWEKNFSPVCIDGFCSVRAAFHPTPGQVLYDIMITPKMSFGTGHHATTASMIRMMKNIDFSGKNVLDFGTGTGVLAILAEKMGASAVMAIDNDEWSFANAVENCGCNNTEHVMVKQATLSDLNPEDKFDIILANINRHILLEYMHDMSNVARADATFLLSGILTEDIPLITASAEANGFVYREEVIENNWVCMKFVKV